MYLFKISNTLNDPNLLKAVTFNVPFHATCYPFMFAVPSFTTTKTSIFPMSTMLRHSNGFNSLQNK